MTACIEPESQRSELRSGNDQTLLNQILWSFQQHPRHECYQTFEDVDVQLAEEVARALEKGDLEARAHRYVLFCSALRTGSQIYDTT